MAALMQAVAITQRSKERVRERKRSKTKGKQKEKTLGVIATPLPKLLTTTVINCNSTLATAVIAN